MPTIADIQAFNLRVPLRKQFSTSNKTTDASRIVLVRVTADDGTAGWGEGAINPSFTDETPAAAGEAIRELVAPSLLGKEVDEATARMPEVHRLLGARVASRCALSTALWDLTARLCRVPLYVLLGGRRRVSVPVAYHIGNFDLEQDAADAKDAAAEGFTIIKLKVGRPDVAEDIEALRRVREAAGPGVRLYVDVNQAWNRQQARAFARHAYEHGVVLVEQPLPGWDIAGIAELGATPGVTFAADESVFDVPQLMGHIMAGQAPGGVVVKLLKAGGVEGTVDLLRLCHAAAVRPFLAGMPGDTSIVSAALLHVGVAALELPLGTAITPHFSAADVVRRPLEVRRGHLDARQLTGPGLGVDVDPDRVDALAVPA